MVIYAELEEEEKDGAVQEYTPSPIPETDSEEFYDANNSSGLDIHPIIVIVITTSGAFAVCLSVFGSLILCKQRKQEKRMIEPNHDEAIIC